MEGRIRRSPAEAGPRSNALRGRNSNTSTRPIELLLPQLDKLKETGSGRWIARCPAHDDGNPSLSVRELDDGRVLLHCFAGCDAADVVGVLGWDLADLFPNRPEDRAASKGQRHIPKDVLRCLYTEAQISLLAAEDVAAGKPMSEADRDRLALAVERLRAGAREAGSHV